jgi:hypothetical protein
MTMRRRWGRRSGGRAPAFTHAGFDGCSVCASSGGRGVEAASSTASERGRGVTDGSNPWTLWFDGSWPSHPTWNLGSQKGAVRVVFVGRIHEPMGRTAPRPPLSEPLPCCFPRFTPLKICIFGPCS